MTLGLIFLPYWPPEQLPAFAEAADAAGLAELWLWEDCFASGGISAAAVALARTARIEVGIGVLPVPLRNVALTAMEVSTLARQFPARLHVGVGHGVLDWMEQAGVRAASPMTLLREYVVALRSLLAGSTVDATGTYVQLRDVTLKWLPDPVPPLYVGATKPKTLALAGELSDGTILTSSTDDAGVAAARTVLDDAGPGRRLIAFTSVAATAAETVTRIRSRSAAGADVVVLEPIEGTAAVAFLRFVLDEVLPAVS
jgi:alkanesulfonate monooxygenase SsuD/methylene tetrahydromethanopterin reductase-like flavin-dependent oxidoreductase (luciferase family)